jgi:hypothetical protein
MALTVVCVLVLGSLLFVVERRRRRAAQALAELALDAGAVASMRGDANVRGAAERARCYLGAASSIIAIVRDDHLLELRDIANVKVSRIREIERDVRRGPYTSNTPIWHDTFLDDGSHTLLVPLIARGRKLGFWMLSFATRESLTAGTRGLLVNLARELACVLDTQRPAPTSLDLLREGLRDHHDLARVCEAMPYGVFVMTVWGHVRYANTAMKLSCAMAGIDLDACDPVALFGGLTGHADVLPELRTLVQTQTPLCLRGSRSSVALSWLGGDDETERLIVGWVLPDSAARIESQPLLASLSMTSINMPATADC